jgi:hypothetical protein
VRPKLDGHPVISSQPLPSAGNLSLSREGPDNAFERAKDRHVDRHSAHDGGHETAPKHAHASSACSSCLGGQPPHRAQERGRACDIADDDVLRLHARLDHVKGEGSQPAEDPRCRTCHEGRCPRARERLYVVRRCGKEAKRALVLGWKTVRDDWIVEETGRGALRESTVRIRLRRAGSSQKTRDKTRGFHLCGRHAVRRLAQGSCAALPRHCRG